MTRRGLPGTAIGIVFMGKLSVSLYHTTVGVGYPLAWHTIPRCSSRRMTALFRIKNTVGGSKVMCEINK